MLVRPPSVKFNKAIGDFALNITRRDLAIGGISLLAGSSVATLARAEFGEMLRDFSEGIEDFTTAQDAYIYGYPLVTMTAIVTALLVIVAFVSAMLHFTHEYGVAILFILALSFFLLSLLDLARETRIGLHEFDYLA